MKKLIFPLITVLTIISCTDQKEVKSKYDGSYTLDRLAVRDSAFALIKEDIPKLYKNLLIKSINASNGSIDIKNDSIIGRLRIDRSRYYFKSPTKESKEGLTFDYKGNHIKVNKIDNSIIIKGLDRNSVYTFKPRQLKQVSQ